MGKSCGLPTVQDIRSVFVFVFFSLSGSCVWPGGSRRLLGMLVLHEVSNSDMAVCVSVIGKEVIQLSGLFFVAG